MSDPKVLETQSWLNVTYGNHPQWNTVTVDGFTGWGTIFGLIRGLQIELGITTLADNFGAGTLSALTTQFGSLSSTTTNMNLIHLAQGALWCKGYSGGWTWGVFDPSLQSSVMNVTAAMGLTALPSISPKVLRSLMSMDAYTLLPGGDATKRAVQQWLNGKYSHRRDFPLLPCDGLFSRNTQQGLMYAIQYELNMADGVANGNFGSGTKSGLQNQAGVAFGSNDYEKNWVRLFQGALRFNNRPAPFTGNFSTATRTETESFQSYAELAVHGAGDYRTWASLLISTGDETRPGIASDMATQLTAPHCAALYNAGYRTVGRYLTVATKRYVPGEIQRIHQAGLATFPIMQEANTLPQHFSFTKGEDHALQATRRLRQLGFKGGTTVFFAVDYDATDDGITSNIIPFFQGLKAGLERTRVPYKVGIYGTRNVCARVINAGLATEAFVASMSWGWSGNLGYALPPSWSYDQIQNLTLPGTGLEIDKNVQSVRASPAAQFDVEATPVVGGAYDAFYWMVTHDTVLAETTGPVESARRQADAVLYYIQRKNAAYLETQFLAYNAGPPGPVSSPSRYFYDNFPTWATSRESWDADAAFLPNFTVVNGTTVGTSHLAVTARGYMNWGRPGPSSFAAATVADLGGWALDLATLWRDFADIHKNARPASYATTYNWFKSRLGVRDANQSTQGSFSFDDLIGDIDGYLIGGRMSDSADRRLDDAVREVRTGIASSDLWRYQTFYHERFGSSQANARAAAINALSSSNFFVDTAVRFTLGGLNFTLGNVFNSTTPLHPNSIELDAVGDAWKDLVKGLATDGTTAAPS
ncbi:MULTISPECIES: glycoside hydrolase domain-containing protein [Microbacterium]|uniref:DUF1906 domain-containing protein n=1 Tax=Microbacterium wangchenii TaxID=2541726 RepID=A0ABX5STN2_9MICO|nr:MULTISPECIES: glycoside hydrolase domain-containing protein [Microbacterium]MCK6068505.1 DUF1906 domain-containing protein [Microbacterium sp. EYE_512]QBR89147.1 DUF1906 domain-containing protein [Microbacterium wangchenii]TXK09221.1 DUF1906 domain-containing protein [Microbacterium wangchenii]